MDNAGPHCRRLEEREGGGWRGGGVGFEEFSSPHLNMWLLWVVRSEGHREGRG